jgi:hypothetical protein
MCITKCALVYTHKHARQQPFHGRSLDYQFHLLDSFSPKCKKSHEISMPSIMDVGTLPESQDDLSGKMLLTQKARHSCRSVAFAGLILNAWILVEFIKTLALARGSSLRTGHFGQLG